MNSLEMRINAALDAMRITQKRAAEDRATAISGVTGRETSALAGYGTSEELLRQGLAEPEAISPAIAAKMYERGRIGIEAGTQATQRQLQESYARRGMPGGAMLGSMMGAAESGIGQKAGLQMNIDIERARKKRADLLSLLGASTTLGGAKANIYGQTGRTLADIYGHTIAEVPTYPAGSFNAPPPSFNITSTPPRGSNFGGGGGGNFGGGGGAPVASAPEPTYGQALDYYGPQSYDYYAPQPNANLGFDYYGGAGMGGSQEPLSEFQIYGQAPYPEAGEMVW